MGRWSKRLREPGWGGVMVNDGSSEASPHHPCASVCIRGCIFIFMKLAEMRQMLSERGIQLTKSLGQNFLHEEKVVAKIAAAGELTKADKVLEIGPGLGPLTELLVAQAGEVLAIEMDARLVELLRGRFQSRPLTPSIAAKPTPNPSKEGSPNSDAPSNVVPLLGGGRGGLLPNVASLQLIHADALKYLETTPRDWRGWKLVANMP